MYDRLIPFKPGLPYMEVVRDELFDTKELAPGGTSSLSFFQQPAPSRMLTNMPSWGQFPYPQQFNLFGLTLDIYSVHRHIDQKIIKVRPRFDELRKILFANSILEYVIGSKFYLEVQTNSIIDGLVPCDVERPSDRFFSVPELTEEDSKRLRSEISTYDVSDYKPLKPNFKGSRKLTGPVIKMREGLHFYNMTVYSPKGRPLPLHIEPQQSFKGEITWAETISFDPDFFGRVFVRMGMAGIRYREVC